MHYFGVGVHYKRDDRAESPYFQSHDKRRRPRLQYRLSAEEAVTTVESRYKEKAMTTVTTLGREDVTPAVESRYKKKSMPTASPQYPRRISSSFYQQAYHLYKQAIYL